jgi:Tol biopolymer transport system component
MVATTFSHYRIRRAIALVSGALIAVVGGALWFHNFRPAAKVATPPMRIVPLTSYPGHQRNPSFSPDGNRIAFVGDTNEEYNWDIYVKQIGKEKLLRLTTDPATDDTPIWSPDGRYIAFQRYGGDKKELKEVIYVVPALGGAERKLLTLNVIASTFDWSPDGKYLAYTDFGPNRSETIFLLAVDNPDDKRSLTASAEQREDYSPRFSPDGQTVAFVRRNRGGDIFLVRVAGGEAKRLTFDDANLYGLNWTPDGAYIIFFSDRQGGRGRLWKVRASGGQPEPLSVGQDVNYDYSLSPDFRRLAYTKYEFNVNIWRYEVSPTAARSAPPTKLIGSTGKDMNPQLSPDGKRVAFVSGRTGSGEIWVCDSDGSNQRQLTFLEGQPAVGPRWSPDGREIAFQSPAYEGAPIYVVSAEGGKPRRLATGRSRVAGPSWSRDGKWIYFGSNRAGAWQVWKIPSKGGHAVQVTKKGGAGGLESPDGKTLYYAKGLRVPGLWKVPVEGGEETPVLKQVWAGFFGTWGLAREGIYYYNDSTKAIEFLSLATHKITQIAKPEKRGGDFSVSPDGRWILFGQVDQDTSHIMMVDNFRW